MCVCGRENGDLKLFAVVNDEEEEAPFPGPFRRWPPCHSPLSLPHNETRFTQTLNFTMRLISLTARPALSGKRTCPENTALPLILPTGPP